MSLHIVPLSEFLPWLGKNVWEVSATLLYRMPRRLAFDTGIHGIIIDLHVACIYVYLLYNAIYFSDWYEAMVI